MELKLKQLYHLHLWFLYWDVSKMPHEKGYWKLHMCLAQVETKEAASQSFKWVVWQDTLIQYTFEEPVTVMSMFQTVVQVCQLAWSRCDSWCEAHLSPAIASIRWYEHANVVVRKLCSNISCIGNANRKCDTTKSQRDHTDKGPYVF